jgi:hypothetical protein
MRVYALSKATSFLLFSYGSLFGTQLFLQEFPARLVYRKPIFAVTVLRGLEEFRGATKRKGSS